MKIIMAKSMGFCTGVKRAVNIVYDQLKGNNRLVTFGPLIHNKYFMNKLKKNGVRQISSLGKAKRGEKLIIRSHGAQKDLYEKLGKDKIPYCDATCKFVVRSQKLVKRLSKENIFTIIVGDVNHPEIVSLESFAKKGRYLITSNLSDLKKIKESEVGILAQTTLTKDFYNQFVHLSKNTFSMVHVYNTICKATEERQKAALILAKKSSVVLVVGGKKSSNTQKIYFLCKEIQKRSYHVETYKELKKGWFRKNDIVGITSGASTPFEQVEEIVKFLEDIF